MMPDTTHNIGQSLAVRATTGFTGGKGIGMPWQVNVQQCSDYSYVGFVDVAWNDFASPVGKSIGSWGTFEREQHGGVFSCGIIRLIVFSTDRVFVLFYYCQNDYFRTGVVPLFVYKNSK